MSPELREIINGLGCNIQQIRQLVSTKNDVWDVLCANDAHLIAKSGKAKIDWPYGEVIEVENEIRTTKALSEVIPQVIPPIVASGVLDSGSWYMVRHAVPIIQFTEAAWVSAEFTEELVKLLNTVTSWEVADALRKVAFMPTIDLRAEVSCLMNQLLPWANAETTDVLVEVEHIISDGLSKLDTACENVVCIGNFTPGNIGASADGRPCLIDCSVFRWGSCLYDVTKLLTYLELQAADSGRRFWDRDASNFLRKHQRQKSRNGHDNVLTWILQIRHGLSWMARDKSRLTATNGRNIMRTFV